MATVENSNSEVDVLVALQAELLKRHGPDFGLYLLCDAALRYQSTSAHNARCIGAAIDVALDYLGEVA